MRLPQGEQRRGADSDDVHGMQQQAVQQPVDATNGGRHGTGVGLQVVNGNEEVRSQLWRRCVDSAMSLPDYATFHLDAAQTGEIQPPAPPQQSAEPPAPQLDYFADELAKLAELNTQVDEDEFKSAISRAFSRAGAHVSVEH